MSRSAEHCVVRWCPKRNKTMIWMPHQTVEPNKCPVVVVDDISMDLITHYEFLGILAYNTTRPGNMSEDSRAVHRQLAASKGWRINAEMEHSIKYGRPVMGGFSTEEEKPNELSETTSTGDDGLVRHAGGAGEDHETHGGTCESQATGG